MRVDSLLLKAGLGSFQGKFKLLLLRRWAYACARESVSVRCVYVRGVCVLLFAVQSERQSSDPAALTICTAVRSVSGSFHVGYLIGASPPPGVGYYSFVDGETAA